MRSSLWRVLRRNGRAGSALLGAAAVLAVVACKPKAESDATDAATPIAPSAASSVSAVAPPKRLPAEPPPPLAGRYDGGALLSWSDLEAKHSALKDIWEPSRRDQLRALLSAISTMVETLDTEGTEQISVPIWNRAKAARLDGAAMDIEPHLPIEGRLPAEMLVALRKHLADVKTEPHLGVWATAAKPTDPTFDLSALAAWVNRDDPAYLREHIAARSKGGTVPWSGRKGVVHRWLAHEDMALAWLGMQLQDRGEKMTPAEQARWLALSTSPLGPSSSAEDVALVDMLSDYKNNELRADTKYRGHVVRFSGVATDIKKNISDDVYAVITTGPEIQTPDIHCAVAKSNEQKAADLNKGSKVTVRGKVSGMMLTSVVVDGCEFD